MRMWKDFQAIWTMIGGVLGWFLGGFDGLFYVLLCFVVMDYITGVIAAGVKKELASEVGFRGIGKKVTIFILVGIGNALDVYMLKQGSVLRTAIIFFYVANEGLSIVENADVIGLPVPKKLKIILREIKEKGDGEDDE